MSGRTVRGGLYNLKVGRRAATVVGEVAHLMTSESLGVLLCCEAPGYVAALTNATRPGGALDGFKVIGYPHGDTATRETCIVVRTSPAGPGGWARRRHRVSGGWERGKGRKGTHPGRAYVSARIGSLGRMLAVHTAPGPFGPKFPARRRANLAALAAQARIGKRWNHRLFNLTGRWLQGGDWNRRPTDPEVKALAAATGATIHAAPTGGIDYVLARGVTITSMRRVSDPRFRSDHKPVVFDATY